MYSFERGSRLYMRGVREETNSPHSAIESVAPQNSSNHATSSERLSRKNRTQTHSTTENARHKAEYRHVDDLQSPDSIEDDRVARTKTQMAQAFQESQELYRTAQERAGLKTVKTRRIVKKTTTITRGENEKMVCSIIHVFRYTSSILSGDFIPRQHLFHLCVSL